MTWFEKEKKWPSEKVQTAGYTIGTIAIIILIIIAAVRFKPSESRLYRGIFPILQTQKSYEQKQKMEIERKKLNENYQKAAALRQKDLEQKNIEAQFSFFTK